jgi:hypothetical protein
MRITVEDKLARYVTVTLDGVDVTNACTMANEQGGYVELVKSTPDGLTFYLAHGAVVIGLPPDASERVTTLYLEQRATEAPAL